PDTRRVDGLGGADRHPPPPRVHAARALVAVGPKATPAIRERVLPALIEELKTDTRHAGGRAAEVLEILGEIATPAVPALVAAVEHNGGTGFADGDDFPRDAEPARALLFLGPEGRKAFDRLLAHPNAAVRRAAVAALDTGPRSDSVPVDVAPFV